MAHGVKYRLQYYRLGGGLTTIDILQRGYSSTITTLLGGASPFESSFEGDPTNIYIPTLGSGAVLHIINETPLSLLELYTADPQEWMVQVWDGITDDDSDASSDAGGHLRWQGFISPEIFSEGYSNPIASQMTIQCNDGMQVLDYIEYSNNSALYTGVQTIAEILTNIFSHLEIEFRTIYMSNDLEVIALEPNLLTHLELFNENFLDESDTPISCRRVLESILGGLGLVMYFEGYDIYIVDPINLHDTAKGRSYSIHTYTEVVTPIGGYIDIAGGTLHWGKTGSNLDLVPAISELLVKYDPYNFTAIEYNFADPLNWDAAGSYVSQDGGLWQLNSSIEYSGWQDDSATVDMQIAIRKATYSASEYVLQLYDSGKDTSYNFPRAVITHDDELTIRLSMDVFFITKLDSANIFDGSGSITVNRVYIPIAIKIGDSYWEGSTDWETSGGDKWQPFEVVQTRNANPANYLQESISDKWVNAYLDIPIRTPAELGLLQGSVTLEILDSLTTHFVGQLTPATSTFFSDTTVAKSNSVGGSGITWTRITDSIIEVTIVGLTTHAEIETRRVLLTNADVTDVDTSAPSGTVVSVTWHDSSHNPTTVTSTVAETTFTLVSYTKSTDTIVYRLTTSGAAYFGVGYDHIEAGTVTNVTYDYDYRAVRLLVKNIKLEVLGTQGYLPIGNNGVETKALLNTNLTGKKTKTVNITCGTGPYGNSRGAFKSDLMSIPGTNITGLYRGVGDDSSATTETYLSNAKLVAQSFMSQYKEPRTILNASFHVKDQAYNIRSKLIKDTNHLGSKAFWMIRGTYYDREEILETTLLEIEDTRETIV